MSKYKRYELLHFKMIIPWTNILSGLNIKLGLEHLYNFNILDGLLTQVKSLQNKIGLKLAQKVISNPSPFKISAKSLMRFSYLFLQTSQISSLEPPTS